MAWESDYSKMLKDPRWKECRDRIIKRDGNKCCRCGNVGILLVHHLRYKYGLAPWEYEDSDLETLCKECHYKEHSAEYDSNINNEEMLFFKWLKLIADNYVFKKTNEFYEKIRVLIGINKYKADCYIGDLMRSGLIKLDNGVYFLNNV